MAALFMAATGCAEEKQLHWAREMEGNHRPSPPRKAGEIIADEDENLRSPTPMWHEEGRHNAMHLQEVMV